MAVGMGSIYAEGENAAVLAWGTSEREREMSYLNSRIRR